ncbi:MAG: response regulator [Planctomycetes bacterium]|nr:response regulator [Planctomycetota bacterium]
MGRDRSSRVERAADFSPRPGAPGKSAARAHPLTVLVVDDEPLIREVTSRVLERAGLTVLSAATGDQACELFRRHDRAIDLVFLDMDLAGECGSAVLRALRRIDPDVRVVLVSGSSGEVLTETHPHGCHAFVRKPFDGPALQRAIQQALV